MSKALADLFQTRVQDTPLTPACIQASRCVALEFGKLVYASGPNIYFTTFDTEPISEHLEQPQKEGKKTGLVSATHVLPHASSSNLASFEFESEVQSIVAKKCKEGWIIGGVDCLGKGIVCLFSNLDNLASPQRVYSLNIPRVLDDGWCGIDAYVPGDKDSSNLAYICIVSALGKTVSLYPLSSSVEASTAGIDPLIVWNSVLPITGIVLAETAKAGKKQEKNVVAIVAETGIVSVYDVHGAVKHRLSNPSEAFPHALLYSIHTERPGGGLEEYGSVQACGDTIAVMGSRGSVWLYSTKAWKSRGTWFAPAKYDLTGLVLDDSNKRLYVSGADQEILGGVYAANASGSGGGNRRKGGGGGEGRRSHAPGFTGGRNPESVPGRVMNVSGAVPGSKRGREESSLPTPTATSDVADSAILESTPVPVPDQVLVTPATTLGTKQSTTPGTTGGPEDTSTPSRFRYTGFRGDSRWVGLSVIAAAAKGTGRKSSDGDASEDSSNEDKQHQLGDILCALSEEGWLYVVTNAEKMAVTVGK